jgi:hypothetical protein
VATKAERARAEQERSGSKTPPRPRRPRRDVPVDTSRPGVSATDRKAGAGDAAARNRSARAADRLERTTNQQRRAIRAASSPHARARKATAARP